MLRRKLFTFAAGSLAQRCRYATETKNGEAIEGGKSETEYSKESKKDKIVGAGENKQPEETKEDLTNIVLPPYVYDGRVVVADRSKGDIVRVKKMPLMLIEEVPLPVRVMSEVELIMTAWSEEQAKHYFMISMFIRVLLFLGISFLAWFYYRTAIAAERRLRGTSNMPPGLNIGCVVFLDLAENGRDLGRVVIGLLTNECPLYCEYFHRRCTGNGGRGESFRGQKMHCLIPRHVAIFGDGQDMKHDVPGYNPHYLPVEYQPPGAWRGALSSIAYNQNKESPNFAIHLSAGEYSPQVFGMVLAGYDIIEKINKKGVKHGCVPKREIVITGCGEICTLDKSKVVPLPWQLYESVSVGYDDEKFGPKSDAKKIFGEKLYEKTRNHWASWLLRHKAAMPEIPENIPVG